MDLPRSLLEPLLNEPEKFNTNIQMPNEAYRHLDHQRSEQSIVRLSRLAGVIISVALLAEMIALAYQCKYQSNLMACFSPIIFERLCDDIRETARVEEPDRRELVLVLV